MIRVARTYLPSHAIAEEVVQEAWLALLQGLSRFQGRSSLKTWLFGILLKRARTRAYKERRSLAFLSPRQQDARDASQANSTFTQRGMFERQRAMVHSWGGGQATVSPESHALNTELRLCLEQALKRLPASQRLVLVLRDVEGWSGAEVCDLLGISPENQRVRLHRARCRMRSALEALNKES